MRVIIAGGYSGGHINAALAIAEGLERAAPGTAILLCGAAGGPEVAAARQAGYPIETVWLSGIDRRRSARGLAMNLLLPLKLAVSRVQARRIVRAFTPDVVVGVGAYPSAPVVMAAQRAGIPTVLHEANAQPGIANRVVSRRANLACLGTESARRWFRCPTVVTGNPVRRRTVSGSPADARRRLGLAPDRSTLLVVGGSLGSRALNGWVLEHQRRFPEDVQVLWQSGGGHHAAARERLGAGGRVTLVPYLDDMAAAYAAADLVVASAGALTLAELFVLGKPAVIVPDREVSEDHQRQTARELAAGGAVVCMDEEIDARLYGLVTELLRDPERRAALGAHLRALAVPDAADRIAAEIVKLRRPAPL